MAQTKAHQKLFWEIQKQLMQLNEEQLCILADVLSLEMPEKAPTLTGSNEAELFDYILRSMKSQQLNQPEFECVSQLLFLQDAITNLLEESDSNTTTRETNPSRQESTDKMLEESDSNTTTRETNPSRQESTDKMLEESDSNTMTREKNPSRQESTDKMLEESDSNTMTREKNPSRQESTDKMLEESDSNTMTRETNPSRQESTDKMLEESDSNTMTRETNPSRQESTDKMLEESDSNTMTREKNPSRQESTDKMLEESDSNTMTREKNPSRQESTDNEFSDTPTCSRREQVPEDVTVPDATNPGIIDVISDRGEDIRDVAFKDLFQRLGLWDSYPKKIQMKDILLIKKLPKSQELTEKDLWFQYVNMVMMLDCRARHLFLRSPEDLANIAHADDKDVQDDDDDFFTSHVKAAEAVPPQTHIHPMDLHMAVFHCSDNFVRQYLNGKLSTCQFALPLLIPNPWTEDIEFPAWALRKIKKTNKNVAEHIFNVPVPIVTIMRLGSSPNSKSQIMSNIINKKKHPVFFNRHCTGSTNNSLLVNGLAEISWYCPGGRDDDVFDRCVAFVNLHGDACQLPRQVRFLQEVSNAMILLLPDRPLKSEELKVAQKLHKVPVPLITLFSELEKVTNSSNANIKFKIAAKNRNEAELTEEIVQKISEFISSETKTCSLEMCLDIVKKNNFKLDEDEKSCKDGKEISQLLMYLLKETSGEPFLDSTLKEKLLPLQGKLWQEWCKNDKLLCRLPNKADTSLEQHASEIKMALKSSRKEQLNAALPLNNFLLKLLKSLSHSEDEEILYMLQWLCMSLDQHTAGILSGLQEKYHKIWMTQRSKMDKNSAQLDKKLSKISAQIKASGFTLNDIMREISQLYEAPHDMKYTGEHKSFFDNLPSIGADMLMLGYPLELMNGDVSHVPLTWLKAVFGKLIQKLGDKNIFVLSVLGVQSSGKSTLLNTMFGLQFAVSAGRCTSGAFMQLLKVDEEMKNQLQYDFVLVIDSEGLRSPELSSEATLTHDNELATFIIGIGDLTLINIMGENPSEMQDILQICAQAFLRMACVNIKPSCIFVHQNVAETTANDKNQEGRRLLEKRLNEIARIAAKDENREAQCFSDIIQFDINTQVFYFKNLLEGDPPMAPPNPSYSQNVQELKTQLLHIKQWQTKCKLSKLSEFKLRIEDLWKALRRENFIFSFRNTLEVMVYNKLENHYADWSWKLRKHALETQQRWLNEIKSHLVADVSVSQLTEDFQDIYKTVTEEMETYFKNEEHTQILVNWRSNTDLRIQNLKDELINETCKLCEEMLNINRSKSQLDSKRTEYEAELLTKSRSLAGKLKDKESKLSDQQMKEQFNILWRELEEKVSREKPTEKAVDIKTKVANILLNHFRKVKNIMEMVQNDWVIFQFKEEYVQLNQGLWKRMWSKTSLSSKKYLKQKGEELTRSILEDVEKNIKQKENKELDFNESYVHEILDLIKQNAKFQNDPNIELTVDYVVDLSIFACSEAVNHFQRMHNTFKKNNDILTYLNSKKRDSFQIFKSFCENASSVEFFVHFLCNHIKSAILKVVPENVSVHIADKMKSDYPAFNGNRNNLENHILDDLASNEKFDDYMTYINFPKTFHEKFIQEKVKNCCDSEETQKMLLSNLSSVVDDTLKTCDEVTCSVNEKNGTASMWLDELCSQLGRKMTLSREDFKIIEKEDLEEKGRGYEKTDIKRFGFFKGKMISSLEEIQKKQDFGKSDMTNMIERAGEILCKQLSGCWEKCPFCAAICTNTIPDHSSLHSMEFHRCGILSGWRYKDTDIAFIDFCTTAVGSTLRFYPQYSSDKTVPFSKYEEAGDPFDKWKITADGSEKCYWKWFICTFQSDLEKKYKCTFESWGKIPDDWKKITKEDALRELNVKPKNHQQMFSFFQ
ncbi:interferon-induced very large GTPase 1-like isoform X2 [Esox lucius]|uniref:interferon-induced very large GTPase 1-like isoform X2 n=1 Tax=Esox lucius TaxID=8010 RepID=UPI0014774276|nr:interferon-induced very large GTPase 1-like isoform X2 [Esox lucius]